MLPLCFWEDNLTKRIYAAILIFILSINLSACKTNGQTRYEAEFIILFDTVTKIVAYTSSRAEFDDCSKLVYDTIEEYHELYNIYNDYEGINNIKTINDNAGIAPVQVDRKIINLLLFAKEEYNNTNGKINIAFGSVLKIWHDYRTEGIDDAQNAKLPPADMLRSAAEHTDITKVIIDEAASTVFLSDPAMRLDVGAVAKGYATEQAAKFAMENGFSSGLISVGGNVRAIGSKSIDNKPWNVGIQNPNKESENKILYTVNLTDNSLVTSGNYERYYTVDGKRYHHIIDPNTLFPTTYFSSVSIVCKDSGVADSLSTAVFNMPFEQGLALIEGMADTEALWIMENGDIRFSSGFERLIKK